MMKSLYSKKWENVKVMRGVERILREKRGFVFRMPSPGQPVILLLSGGLDSIISWAILLKRYQLKVFPVYLIRGKRSDGKREEYAIDYYAAKYKEKYSTMYNPPHKLPVSMFEFTDPYNDLIGYLHPQVIIDNLLPDGSLKPSFVLGHFSLFPFLGFLYAKFLHAREYIDAKTIFCGTTFSDNVSYRSLTSARSTMLTLNLLSGENNWQYTSVAYEPTIRSLLTKSDLIRWASEEGIPLDRAWTCIRRNKLQCGDCLACISRKRAFQEAGVADLTPYGHTTQFWMVSIFKRIMLRLKQQNNTQNVMKRKKSYVGPSKSKIYLSI